MRVKFAQSLEGLLAWDQDGGLEFAMDGSLSAAAGTRQSQFRLKYGTRAFGAGHAQPERARFTGDRQFRGRNAAQRAMAGACPDEAARAGSARETDQADAARPRAGFGLWLYPSRGLFAIAGRHRESRPFPADVAECARLLILKTFGLFVVTAFAEIIGCYLPYLWRVAHPGCSFPAW